MNLRLESAQAYLEQMKLDLAYRQIRTLLDRRPPEAIRLKAVAQNTKITEATQGLVTEALAMLQSGEGTVAQLDSMLALYKRITPPNPKDEFIANSEKARSAIVRTRELETIAQAFNEGKMDRIALLGKLVNMRKQYPGYDKLPELIDKFAQPMEKKEIGIINAGIAGGDLKAADQAFENLKRILAIVAPENAAAQLAGYQQSLEQNRTARLMQELRTSFEAADYEKTLEMTKEADSRPLKPEEKALIQAISKKANAKLAVARWIWMQDLEKGGKFSGGHLSLEEAERTVTIFPQVSEFLPRAAYPKVDDDLLFFAAMAYRQIGQNPKANELFERLKKDYPKSNLIKMADHYTQLAEKKP